jgi:hypothetical protein
VLSLYHEDVGEPESAWIIGRASHRALMQVSERVRSLIDDSRADRHRGWQQSEQALANLFNSCSASSDTHARRESTPVTCLIKSISAHDKM